MTSSELHQSSLASASAQQEFIRGELASLTHLQLNWKPDIRSWSVAQCLDHLNISNVLYFPIIERALYTVREKPEFQDQGDALMHTLTGNMMIKMVQPASRKRVKSPKLFLPLKNDYDHSVVTAFLEQNDRLIRFMNDSQNLNLMKIKVYSPVNRVFKFNLGDCYAILVNHNERHKQQITRILQHPEFPVA
jgi:hypothetical protein